MSALAEFLHLLLHEGRAVLRTPPSPAGPAEEEAAAVLRAAYATYRLEVAGPAIAFDAPTALAAGALVRQACWFLVSHAQPVAELDRRLVMPGRPQSPKQHLSADLVLRFLPQVHRRARALDPADRLPALLAGVLRRWPLSGVLSAVEEAPLTPPAFPHPGLRLLYAERLARNEKPAWFPEGAGLECVRLVWAELGKDAPAPPGEGRAAGGKGEEGGGGGD